MNPPGEPGRNVEIKARCPNLAAMRILALESGAEFVGEELQRDTYFRVPAGRLKLRSATGSGGRRSELIRYRRNDTPAPRLSSYTIKPVRLPGLLRSWLTLRRGVLIEVFKRRELWLWRGVRIHLDDVRDLGTFVELEAVVDDIGSDEQASHRCRQLIALLEIPAGEMVGQSYADLLISARK